MVPNPRSSPYRRRWGRLAGLLAGVACLLLLPSLFVAALAQPLDPVIRVGVLKFGTVNWELDVLQYHQLAKQQGIEVEVVPLASKNALSVALQGGAVDVIVSDWIWVSRQRSDGRPYTFVPYSLAVGALIVRPDAGISQISDLQGRKVGIAGGPVDKSWLLMRAYVRQTLDRDLLEMVEPNFAAPPLLNALMMRGELPAVINFWHYAARLKVAGMTPLLEVRAILPALGIETPVPLLGWVFDETRADSDRKLYEAFLRASYAAKQILGTSDSEWQRIRPLTKVDNDDTLDALRDAYRAGIPRQFGAAERRAAEETFRILAQEGGDKLVGKSTQLSPGTFWDGFQIDP